MALKRGLGRGLDAILQKPEEIGGVRMMARTALEPNRRQPRTRFDDAGLASLAESISAQGVIQPLIVAPIEGSDRYTIVAGERRWRAARLAGIDKLPVVVREVRDEREMLEVALVENLQRADLNAIEEAEAYRSLREDFSLSQQQIGERVGRSRSAVTNTLRLLRLPSEVQDLLRDGKLTAGQVRPLVTLKASSAQIELARKICSEGLSARQIETLAGQLKKRGLDGPEAAGRKKRAARGTADVHDEAAAERLTRALQTKVEIRRRGKGGAVRIHFYSEDELMRLYDKLLGAAVSQE